MDKIIYIDFSIEDYIKLYIYETLSWYILEKDISRSSEESLGYKYRWMVIEIKWSICFYNVS